MYKRYLCFSFPDYYPCGGLGDCQISFDILDEARVWFANQTADNYYVFDRLTGSIIMSN